MVRLRFVGLIVIFMTHSTAFAQDCTPTPPSGTFTNYGYLDENYGAVPVGISVIKFLSGYGASNGIDVSFSASLDACSDPSFALLGTHCDFYEGGRTCYAIVSFMPTSLGSRSGILYGQIGITYPPEYQIAPVNELDTVYLSGTGIMPTTNDKFKIIKSVTGSTSSDVIDQMDPSVGACGQFAQKNVTKKINLKCINEVTGEPVVCMAQVSLDAGGENGGHDHADGRPLGILNGTRFTSDSSFVVSVAIPVEGIDLTYQSPEVSGDVSLHVLATGPNGSPISVNPTIIHVRNSTIFLPLSAPSLVFDIESHSRGNYGTPTLNAKIQTVVAKFNKRMALAGFAPRLIRITAMSLPWGGLFDVHQNWGIPHCSHRDGKTVDFGLASFQGSDGPSIRQLLDDVIKDAGGLFYGVGEGPTDVTDHWHVHMN